MQEISIAFLATHTSKQPLPVNEPYQSLIERDEQRSSI